MGRLCIPRLRGDSSDTHALGMCRKALERTDARVLRLMFAMKPWQKPMTYIEGESLAEAQRKDEIFKSFFARTQALLAKPIPFSGQPAETWLVRRACPS